MTTNGAGAAPLFIMFLSRRTRFYGTFYSYMICIVSHLQLEWLDMQYGWNRRQSNVQEKALSGDVVGSKFRLGGTKKVANLGALTSTWPRLLYNERNTCSFAMNDHDKKHEHFYYCFVKEHYEEDGEKALWMFLVDGECARAYFAVSI